MPILQRESTTVAKRAPGLRRHGTPSHGAAVLLRGAIRRLGYDVSRVRRIDGAANDIESSFLAVLPVVQPYTMTSPERLYAMWQAVRYVSDRPIPGAIVECGVWRGGSMMTAAHALLVTGTGTRDLYLFDTFEGMTPPGPADHRSDGAAATELLAMAPRNDSSPVWCVASLADVRCNMASAGYPESQVHLVAGPVEETVPAQAPEQIAVLRLDTDWYQSTRHELEQLFDRISSGGVLIIDDYGHWEGARRAVDEFLATRPSLLLHRIDADARICVVQR